MAEHGMNRYCIPVHLTGMEVEDIIRWRWCPENEEQCRDGIQALIAACILNHPDGYTVEQISAEAWCLFGSYNVDYWGYDSADKPTKREQAIMDYGWSPYLFETEAKKMSILKNTELCQVVQNFWPCVHELLEKMLENPLKGNYYDM